MLTKKKKNNKGGETYIRRGDNVVKEGRPKKTIYKEGRQC